MVRYLQITRSVNNYLIMFTERNINVMIIKSKILHRGTVGVVVSFKIPIHNIRVQFPDGAKVENFFAFLRNENSIFPTLEQKFLRSWLVVNSSLDYLMRNFKNKTELSQNWPRWCSGIIQDSHS